MIGLEEYIEKIKKLGWDTEPEIKFFTNLHGYFSKLNADPEKYAEDVIDGIEKYNSHTKQGRLELSEKLREISDDPEYKFPYQLRVSFAFDVLQRDLSEDNSDDYEDDNIFVNDEVDEEVYAFDKEKEDNIARMLNNKVQADADRKKQIDKDGMDADVELYENELENFKASQDYKVGEKGDFAKKVSFKKYVDTIRKNGWVDETDLNTFKTLYKISEQLSYKHLDDFLRDSMKDKSAYDAGERIRYLKSRVDDIYRELRDRRFIDNKLFYNTIDTFIFKDQERIDREYERALGVKRPKSQKEIELDEKRKNLKPGEILLEDYTTEKFLQEAEKKGWIDYDDSKLLKDLFEYKSHNNWRPEPNMDQLLVKIMKTPVWRKSDRDNLLNEVSRVVNRQELFGYTFNKDYRENIKQKIETVKNITQEELDDHYFVEFGEERQKSDDELEEEKRAKEEAEREKQKALERFRRDEYEAKRYENRRNFSKKYGLGEDEYYQIVHKNGWGYEGFIQESDERGIKTIYDLARSSGNPELISLLDRLLNTEVDTKDKRDAAVRDIYDTLKSVQSSGTLYGDDRRALDKFIKEKVIAHNVSEKSVDELAEHIKDEKREASRIQNIKAFENHMHNNGWSKDYDAVWKNLYDYQVSELVNNVSPIDGILGELMKVKINPDLPAKSSNDFLRDFLDKFKVAEYKKAYKGSVIRAIDDAIEITKEKEAADIQIIEVAAKKVRDAETNKKMAALRENFKLDGQEGVGKIVNPDTKKDNIKPAEADDTVKLAEKVIADNIKAEMAAKKKADHERYKSLRENFTEKPKAHSKDEASLSKRHTVRKNLHAIDNKTLENMKKEAKEFKTSINKVDFNLLGKGSPEFNKIVVDINALNDYAQRNLRPDRNGNVDTSVLATYFDKQKTCIDSIRSYLARKQHEFQEDPTRINASNRQSHEQPRIHTNISILEKMETSYAFGKYAIEANMQGLMKPRLEEMLKNEETLRDDKDITVVNYLSSLNRSKELIGKINGDIWTPSTKEDGTAETLTEYVNRIKTVTTLGEDEVAINDNQKVDDAGYKRVSNKELEQIMLRGDDALKNEWKNAKIKENYDPKIRVSEVKQETLQMRENMLSDGEKLKYSLMGKNKAKDIEGPRVRI